MPAATPKTPFSAVLRVLFLGLVRLFHPTITVSGLGRRPDAGPVIVVANHPNGLLDPVVLRLAVRRPLAFLAKSTLFGNPLGRAAMAAFDAIPVYRAHEADTRRNEETFDRCRRTLAAGGWLALFPEGTSHSDPQLKPLKTGAARIALSVEAAAGFSGALRVLPVGLIYDDKATFRSAVTAVVGEPFTLETFAETYRTDERAAVATLTDRLAERLAELVVFAESVDAQRALLAVAAWTQADGGQDRVRVETEARRLARAWRRLRVEDPTAADALTATFRRYRRLVQTLGIRDAAAWEPETRPSPAAFAASLAPLLLLWPLAGLGAALAWLPYRAVRPLAVRVAGGQTDLIGTMKLLGGLLFLGATYAGWTLAAGLAFGPVAALAMAFVGPASGYVALRFGERVERRRELLRAMWLRATRRQADEAVRAARRRLAHDVQTALARLAENDAEEKKVGAAV